MCVKPLRLFWLAMMSIQIVGLAVAVAEEKTMSRQVLQGAEWSEAVLAD
jgi:hypothetical protein